MGRADLNIFLTNTSGTPVNAAEIFYALYDFTTGQEVLIGSDKRVPANPSKGEYYASIIVPLDANLGNYRMRWTFRETFGGTIQQVVQEFVVLDKAALTSPGASMITGGATTATEIERYLMGRLRILLRDNNPSRNYSFRPPTHEETVNQFNRVFGYIWEDVELQEYIERGLDMIISSPPRTPFSSVDQMVQTKPEWRTLLLTGAMIHALQAVRLSWVSEEFSLAGNTLVRVFLPGGGQTDIPLDELYNICHVPVTGGPILEAFQNGALQVESVLPTGEVIKATVTGVMKHNTAGRDCRRVSVGAGIYADVTEDHSLFTMPTGTPVAVPSGAIQVGEPLALVLGGNLQAKPVYSNLSIPPQPFMYDLSVPGPQNFVLTNGLLAHNSYSIGGVSLDLDKASKYEAAEQSAAEQFDKQLEKAKATVNIIRGLKQQKFGGGLRSAFGPYNSAGILSPGRFMGL